jgi:hypothetical protein
VNIEDHLGAAPFGRQGREHQEVRHRMHLYDVDAVVATQARNLQARSEEEGAVAGQVAQRPGVAVRERPHVVQVDSTEVGLAPKPIRLRADQIHDVSALHERLCLASDARVTDVIGECDHANSGHD